jgi:hypothetical protein
MPNSLNVKNSIQIINDLQGIDIDENARICYFDIRNMYTNIPLKML